MASHQVAIAKASLAAALLRPDPVAISRDEIAQFHRLFDAVVDQCSAVNVQKCKHWLLSTTVASSARLTALGKFLVAFSASLRPAATRPGQPKQGSGKQRPSARSRQLHVLYLVHDLIHHVKFRDNAADIGVSVLTQFRPVIRELLLSTVSGTTHRRHQTRVGELVKIWRDKEYFALSTIDEFDDAIRNASKASGAAGSEATPAEGQAKGQAGTQKKAAFIMPATHGDPSTPYYDLPAANLMPLIEPNDSAPINPLLMQALRLSAGPAEPSLVSVVSDFLRDVDRIFGPDSEGDDLELVDVDDLGQRLYRDPATDEFADRQGYYGWSLAFCERMKADRGRRRTKEGDRGPGGRGSLQGRRVRSGSDSSRGRRRSWSSSSDRSGHRGRASRTDRYRMRSASGSRSRSRSPDRAWPRDGRDRATRDVDRPRSRSPKTHMARPPPSGTHSLPAPPPSSFPLGPAQHAWPAMPQAPPHFHQSGTSFPYPPTGVPFPPPPPPPR